MNTTERNETFNALAEAISRVVNTREYAEAYKRTRPYICNNSYIGSKRVRWMYKNLPRPKDYCECNLSSTTMRRIIENLRDIDNIKDTFFSGWIDSAEDIFNIIAVFELLSDDYEYHEYSQSNLTVGEINLMLPQPNVTDNDHEPLTDDEAVNLAYAMNIMKFYGIDDYMRSKIAYNIALKIVGRPDNLNDLRDEVKSQVDKEFHEKISSYEYLEAYHQFDNNYEDDETYFNELMPSPDFDIYAVDINRRSIKYMALNGYFSHMALNGDFTFYNPFIMRGSGYHRDIEKLAVAVFDIMEGEIHTIESMGDGKILVNDGNVLNYKTSPSNISDVLYIYSIMKFYKLNNDKLIELAESMMR